MNEYNRRLSQELIKRYNPIEQQDLKDLEFTSASLNENKYEHIDGKISFTTQAVETHITTDIKDRKSLKRGQPKNDRYLWVEIKNPYGYHGWAFGEAHYIAFKQETQWLFVWREDLIQLLKDKVEKIYVKDFPLYKLYNRSGSKDVLTLVDSKDLNSIIIPRKL
tara:strand:- start:17 stop:508 length:492 start_codon:yes stop_codon:yes gene_type:complete